MIVKGITESGFKFEVETDKLSTWNYVEAIKRTQEDGVGQICGYVDMINIMMGKDGMKALKEHLGEDMTMKQVDKEITEILNIIREKNSVAKN